jgi:hypothetical protein
MKKPQQRQSLPSMQQQRIPFAIGLTLVLIAFSTMESSKYLKSIQHSTQALHQQLEVSGFFAIPTTMTTTTTTTTTFVSQNESHQINAEEMTPRPPTLLLSPFQPSAFQNDHPMCQRLAFPPAVNANDNNRQQQGSSPLYNGNILNAGNLWHSYLERILEASYYPIDPNNDNTHILDNTLQLIYRNLFFDLSPTQLEQGLLTHPQAAQVERIWNILEERRLQPDKTPPLRVLVMGGSVVEGVGCVQHQEGIEWDLVGQNCAWPARLQAFVNQILGYDAIQVINIAKGGTGTSQALSIIKYWMYLPLFQGNVPDVIIHAFGSNDSHLGIVPPTEHARILELHQQATYRLNDFVQSVFYSHPCPSPLVVHLDDYFGGHRQGALLGDFTYRMVLKEVAGWYGNMAVSSAQVVDELVYPDTLGEIAFSPKWIIKQRGPMAGLYTENVHYGYGGHLAVLWTWAYSALKVALDFCHEKDWEQHRTEHAKNHFGNPIQRGSFIRENVHRVKGYMPPPLDYSMDLRNISAAMLAERSRQDVRCQNMPQSPPCIMAFVAG